MPFPPPRRMTDDTARWMDPRQIRQPSPAMQTQPDPYALPAPPPSPTPMEAPALPPVESASDSQWNPPDQSPVIPPQAGPAAVGPTGGYRVKAGDNLWDIAKKLTWNGANWQEIYRLNKAKIGNNPDLIQPGMDLILPS